MFSPLVLARWMVTALVWLMGTAYRGCQREPAALAAPDVDGTKHQLFAVSPVIKCNIFLVLSSHTVVTTFEYLEEHVANNLAHLRKTLNNP
jgi:hypothetical protein